MTDAAEAIRTMLVRGAPLIGATAAYGVALALRGRSVRRGLDRRQRRLLGATRPTAVNLRWALDACGARCAAAAGERGAAALRERAADLPRRTSHAAGASASTARR